jgi:hypothetical protein
LRVLRFCRQGRARLRHSAQASEQPQERGARLAVNARPPALARPGHVERADPVAREPRPEPRRLDAAFERHDEHRLAVALARKPHGEQRSAFERAADEHQRAVGVAHVPGGALRVACRGRLAQAVARRNRAVLGTPAARAPAAGRKAERTRDIQRGAVHAALAAGNDANPDWRHGAVLYRRRDTIPA